MAVTLAGQGVMKMAPIFSGGRPVFLTASRLAIRAATSTGAFSGRIWSMRPGNRTRISLVTAGQAELMTGRGRRPVCISFRVAAETISAAFATSKTSSNPKARRADRTMSTSSRLLNCAINDGAGRAIVYS